MDALVGAVEQSNAYLILQFLNRPAQGGLGDLEVLRGFGKGPGLLNRYDIT